MLFDTLDYALFFAVVLLLTAALRPSHAKVFLVVASYVFYAFWDTRFVLLLGGLTVVNYACGLWIDTCGRRTHRCAVTITIIANLVVLGLFKYFNFFVDTLHTLTGLPIDGWVLRIVLPVGISFITFEGIAYAVDVYRGHLRAVRKPVDFMLFVAFFPHLVAGPIIRPIEFLPQVGRPLLLSDEDARWGMREILKGLFKKMVLADYLAPIADAYFQHAPFAGAAVPAWVGVLAFSLQIYFDFSGYTDIARGSARLLGFSFPSNFERPYLSANITDFWRRWHMSLSTWLRDYLYIPLGGNRHGTARTYANLLIVMGLGGLWHGASWNFAIWGIYHGLLLSLHRIWRRVIEGTRWRKIVDSPLLSPLWIAATFLLVTLGWIPFRAPNFAATLVTLQDLWQPPSSGFVVSHSGVAIIALGSLGWCMLDRDRRWQGWIVERASWPVAAACGGVLAIALELFARVDAKIPFIYFQF